MKVYNKLVRDHIPEIVEADGSTCFTKIMTDEEHLEKLDAKLSEELSEFKESHNVEELADLLEVIYAAAAARGCSAEQLDAIRGKKAQERGRFEKKILLLGVKEANEPTPDAPAVSRAELAKFFENLASNFETYWTKDHYAVVLKTLQDHGTRVQSETGLSYIRYSKSCPLEDSLVHALSKGCSLSFAMRTAEHYFGPYIEAVEAIEFTDDLPQTLREIANNIRNSLENN